MIKAVLNTKHYFQAPEEHFWQWAEKGEVIETRGGVTICFRDDLINILTEISSEGLPPLTPILMVIAACQNEFSIQDKLFLLRALDRFEDSEQGAEVDKAIVFLKLIHQLPAELRTGRKRVHLLYEIFEKKGFVFSNMELKESLDELRSGRLDEMIMEKGEPISREQFNIELNYLVKALDRFPTTKSLEIKLRTGFDEIPAAAEIILPASTPPDLFEQLSEDDKTAGISRLARRLISVLNIPMHSQGSGEQSYGGISDITNRGNYDRLLLSELAQDEILLMARLVNNESLYFRREEPPDNPKRQRTILLDTTLKMWGVPRVFAISAALAFANNSKHGELIEAYALGGDKYSPINLGDRDGIIQALEQLHHSLHCGRALEAIINDLPTLEQNEFILITDERLFRSSEFHASLSKVREQISFIVTVSRTGELEFFESIKGKTRSLSSAKLDIDELLYTREKFSPILKKGDLNDPAFLQRSPSPLLSPKVRIKRIKGRQFLIEGIGIVTVSETQRLLLLKSKEKGALELLNFIERGEYNVGWDRSDELYVVVTNFQRAFLKIYKISLSSLITSSQVLSNEIVYVQRVIFHGSNLYMQTHYADVLFNCDRMQLEKKENNGYYSAEFNTKEDSMATILDSATEHEYFGSSIGSHSVMYKIKEMYISDEGKLVLGNYHLDLVWNNHNIRIKENTHKQVGVKHAREVNNHLRLIPNKGIKFSLWTWQDGSEAIFDSRGFLHLRSSYTRLPEITIVLITGNNTACWNSDGVVCGNSYFVEESRSMSIPAEDFYKKYIQAFIDRLT